MFRSQKKTIEHVLLSLLPALAVLLWASSPAAADGSRRVKYSQNDIVPISAKIRFSTVIVLPPAEEIMTITTGDKEFWIINGNHNLCYVHPAKPDSRSNMNIVTSSGHVYSFLLNEISKVPNAEPDLKVFVDPTEDSFVTGQAATVAYVRASEVEAYRTELTALRSDQEGKIRAAKENAETQIAQFKREFPAHLQFDYRLDKHASQPPFHVTAIYHDDKFTYIKSDAQEKPTIYEMKDGKPNLINFDFENGMYIVPKVMDSGYLAVGKRKCSFERRTLTVSR